MILVILPLGKEANEVLYWLARVLMYTAASILGAAVLALVLGLAGQGLHALFPGFPIEWAVLLLGMLSLLYDLHELKVIKLPTAQMGWQVPKSWQRSSRLVGNTLYGFVLGMGIWTFIPFASFYLVLLWELVAGAYSLQAAVLIGMVYGAARGIPAIVGGISMLRDEYPIPVSNWLIERLGWWHALNGFALLLVGGFLLGSLII